MFGDITPATITFMLLVISIRIATNVVNNGCVNRHISRVWEDVNQKVFFQKARDSPKGNVWCGVMMNLILEPFCCAENTINGHFHLDMLT